MADFFPIVVWGNQARPVAEYCGKGSEVVVSGRLQVRSYEDNDGKRVYVTEVVANNVYFTSGTRANGNGNGGGRNGGGYYNQGYGQGVPEIDPEDVPF